MPNSHNTLKSYKQTKLQINEPTPEASALAINSFIKENQVLSHMFSFVE